ncbi:hypothetical protein [Serratia sp. (in: enterobacteria)]|uniref:hypothetical protein n=1 Tax=Serratia sp. (in: enterobacteria) TaxID=616 RepID=UPI003989D6F7
MSGNPTIPRINGISRRRLLGYVGKGLVSTLMSPLPLGAFAAEQTSSTASFVFWGNAAGNTLRYRHNRWKRSANRSSVMRVRVMPLIV